MPRRFPRALTWAMAIAAAACVACWGLSTQYYLWYKEYDGRVGLGVALEDGTLSGRLWSNDEFPAWALPVHRARPRWIVGTIPHGVQLDWWPWLGRDRRGLRGGVPLWIPGAAFSLGAVWLVWFDRARAGQCPKCRYDRAGLAEGAACPECGAEGK